MQRLTDWFDRLKSSHEGLGGTKYDRSASRGFYKSISGFVSAASLLPKEGGDDGIHAAWGAIHALQSAMKHGLPGALAADLETTPVEEAQAIAAAHGAEGTPKALQEWCIGMARATAESSRLAQLLSNSRVSAAPQLVALHVLATSALAAEWIRAGKVPPEHNFPLTSHATSWLKAVFATMSRMRSVGDVMAHMCIAYSAWSARLRSWKKATKR